MCRKVEAICRFAWTNSIAVGYCLLRDWLDLLSRRLQAAIERCRRRGGLRCRWPESILVELPLSRCSHREWHSDHLSAPDEISRSRVKTSLPQPPLPPPPTGELFDWPSPIIRQMCALSSMYNVHQHSLSCSCCYPCLLFYLLCAFGVRDLLLPRMICFLAILLPSHSLPTNAEAGAERNAFRH